MDQLTSIKYQLTSFTHTKCQKYCENKQTDSCTSQSHELLMFKKKHQVSIRCRCIQNAKFLYQLYV